MEPGKRADVTALTSDEKFGNPYEYLLHEACPEKVFLTMVDGMTLYERQE